MDSLSYDVCQNILEVSQRVFQKRLHDELIEDGPSTAVYCIGIEQNKRLVTLSFQ